MALALINRVIVLGSTEDSGMKCNCKVIDMIALLLVVVGGLNWGLVAFDFNLVSFIFGEGAMLAKVVYGTVGVAAVYHLYRGLTSK